MGDMRNGLPNIHADDLDEGEANCDLAIGCCTAMCRNGLGDELLAFSQQWPQVNLGIQEMPRSALLPALRNGALSLAVLPGPLQPGLQALQLWDDQVMVALAETHPLAGEASISPKQLLDQVVLMSREAHGGDMHRFLQHCVLPFGPPLNGFLTDLSHARLMARVAAGEGVALVCASNAEIVDHVVTRPVSAPTARFPVHAYWREGELDGPLSALIAMLKTLRD
jgi:DNA-binding transcriptional LysR family regulator